MTVEAALAPAGRVARLARVTSRAAELRRLHAGPAPVADLRRREHGAHALRRAARALGSPQAAAGRAVAAPIPAAARLHVAVILRVRPLHHRPARPLPVAHPARPALGLGVRAVGQSRAQPFAPADVAGLAGALARRVTAEAVYAERGRASLRPEARLPPPLHAPARPVAHRSVAADTRLLDVEQGGAGADRARLGAAPAGCGAGAVAAHTPAAVPVEAVRVRRAHGREAQLAAPGTVAGGHAPARVRVLAARAGYAGPAAPRAITALAGLRAALRAAEPVTAVAANALVVPGAGLAVLEPAPAPRVAAVSIRAAVLVLVEAHHPAAPLAAPESTAPAHPLADLRAARAVRAVAAQTFGRRPAAGTQTNATTPLGVA